MNYIREDQQQQLAHSGELRHWLSWRKHPLKCWNYVLIFLLSFAPMPLGNCLFAAATATAELSRQGVSVSLCLLCRLLHQEDTADFCCISCHRHHRLGHRRAALYVNFLRGGKHYRVYTVHWGAVYSITGINTSLIMAYRKTSLWIF